MKKIIFLAYCLSCTVFAQSKLVTVGPGEDFSSESKISKFQNRSSAGPTTDAFKISQGDILSIEMESVPLTDRNSNQCAGSITLGGRSGTDYGNKVSMRRGTLYYDGRAWSGSQPEAYLNRLSVTLKSGMKLKFPSLCSIYGPEYGVASALSELKIGDLQTQDCKKTETCFNGSCTISYGKQVVTRALEGVVTGEHVNTWTWIVSTGPCL